MYNRIPNNVSGVYVRNIDPKSNAFSKGLREGEIISEINGEPIESVSDFKKAVSKIKSGEMVSFYVQSGGMGRYIYFKAE